MLALRLYDKMDLRLEEVPVPEITDGEILMKVDAAAVCGTDIRMWKNGKAGVDPAHPLILGHEFAGEIAKVGKGVPEEYRVGTKVAAQPNIGCGICDMCVSGRPHLCASYRAFGINMDGAMAEYMKIPADAVSKGNLCILPKGVSAAEAAVVEPLSAVYNGFSKCFVKPGEYALVVGAGPIGCCHAMMLHMAGAVVAMNDISATRLKDVKEKLPYIQTYCGDDLAGFVNGWTDGRGLDIAITACPVPAVQAAMLPLMNYGGRVNFFGGIPESQEPVAINTNYIHYKELIVTGSTRQSTAQYRTIMSFIASGLLDVRSIITDRYRPEESLQAFENAAAAKGIKHVIEF